MQETYGPLVSVVAGGLGHLYCLGNHDCGLALWRVMRLGVVVYPVGGGDIVIAGVWTA